VNSKLKSKPIRLCLVSPVPPPYGGIAHWTALISAYAKNRCDIFISQINTAPNWRSIHRTGIFVRSFGGSIQLLADVVKLCFSLARNHFDAIHLTTSGHLGVVRDLAVAIVAKAFHTPLVLHIRYGRIPAIASRNSLEWRLLRIVMNMVSRIILIDRATYEAVLNYFPASKVELIPNCVNAELLPPSRPRGICTTRVALFLGWVIPAKGIDELLAAWARLRPPGWRLDLIGSCSPEYRDSLIEKHGAENVNFLGELPHDVAMMHLVACDLFIFPSHTEGFPNVIAEAMTLGCAILATSVGAVPEMLASNAGVIVDPHDISALEREMRRLFFDEELRISLGKTAEARAARYYSIDAVFREYMRVWGDVSA